MMRESTATLSRSRKMIGLDRWLLFSAAALILLGLLMVASSSMEVAERMFHNRFHFFYRQLAFALAGLFAAIIAFRIPVTWWLRASPYFLLITYLMLILVLVPGIGRQVNGSSRWLGVGGFGGQVSELAKVFWIIFLAGLLERRQREIIESPHGFLKPMLLLSGLVFLLLLEPDFGAAVVMIAVTLGLLFIAGVPLRYYLLLFVGVIIIVAALAFGSPYRLERLTAFLNPWANQFGSGYQLTQSLIAFGRGGWFGLGLGDSVQKLFYLPEAHTDFLFAVLAEELGFGGVIVVIGLFVILLIRILRMSYRALNTKAYYMGYAGVGFAICLTCEAVVNIGVNKGILPTKGLALPFMSYGGSSLMVNCVIIGILLRLDRDSRIKKHGY
jgi:cell division protein FtsW